MFSGGWRVGGSVSVVERGEEREVSICDEHPSVISS